MSQDVPKERTAFIPKVLCTKRNLECKTTTLLGVNGCVPFGYGDSSYMQGTVAMKGIEITSYVPVSIIVQQDATIYSLLHF